MFTIIRRFRLTRGSTEEISRRVRESFVPLLQELPGFRGYYLLESGPDVLISIRVFDSADEALASNEIAATWMRENVLEFVKGMPEVMAGNVLVAADKAMLNVRAQFPHSKSTRLPVIGNTVRPRRLQRGHSKSLMDAGCIATRLRHSWG
jgi:hypothetical protein